MKRTWPRYWVSRGERVISLLWRSRGPRHYVEGLWLFNPRDRWTKVGTDGDRWTAANMTRYDMREITPAEAKRLMKGKGGTSTGASK